MPVRMTREALDKRRRKFMPDGAPRWMRIYDNGGATADRYTVVFTGRYTHLTGGEHWVLGMSGVPFHPQGVCLHNCYRRIVDCPAAGWPPALGRRCHLGRRIRFEDLPQDCRKAARMDYEYLWDLTDRPHPCSGDTEGPVVIVPSRPSRSA